MARITLKLTIRTDQQRKDGKSAVRVRITRGRISRYYHTGIFLVYHNDPKKSEWNDDATLEKRNWVRSKHRDHVYLNDRLLYIYRSLEGLATEKPAFTAEQLLAAYSTPVAEPDICTGFIAFCREWISRKERLDQAGTAECYKTRLGYFLDFWGKRPDDIALLTPTVATELVANLKVRLSPSTVESTLSTLRSFFRHAVLEGWVPKGINPFDGLRVETKLKEIESITPLQIKELAHLDPLPRVQRDARNTFLLQYYLNGARVSEACELKWTDVKKDRVSYRPKKRSRESKHIPLHENLQAILDQYERRGTYVLPYLQDNFEKLTAKEQHIIRKQVNAKIGAALKKLGKRAGLERLTSHMQRHTFALQAWELTGDLRKTQELIGHASATTTERYLRARVLDMDKDMAEAMFA